MPISSTDSTPFRFGTAPRFAEDVSKFERPPPGPIYNIKSTLNTGIRDTDKLDEMTMTVKSKKKVEIKADVPAMDRTSWLTGGRAVRHQNPGPKYTPNYALTRKRPKAPTIAHGPRFENKKRYVNKELLRDNLLTESPGAKYDVTNTKAITPQPPSHSFGAPQHRPRPNQHYAYLEHYMGEIMPGVGPGAYVTEHWQEIGPDGIKNGSSSVTIGEAKRFQDAVKGQFISTKHSKHNRMGLYSPGPMYNPQQHSIQARLKKKKQRIPADGAFPTQPGDFVRTTALKPRTTDRSAFLYSKNVKGPMMASGQLEASYKLFDDSPGPGAYTLPSTFHQWGGSARSGYYDPLSAREKKKKKKATTRRGNNKSGSQTARVRSKPKTSSDLKFTFKHREERLDKTKKILMDQIKKTDSSTGELMLPAKTRARLAKFANTGGHDTGRAQPTGRNSPKKVGKAAAPKKKEIAPLNNPFKSLNQYRKDVEKMEYRNIGEFK